MTAMLGKEDKSALVSQCLDFCQTLADKSLTFSFALSLGDSFSFSLETSEKEAVASKTKKKTPSTLKRDARRRNEFVKKKLEVSTGEKTLDEGVFKCDQCGNIFKSENGLKIHVGKSHKKVNPEVPATPDTLRQQPRTSVSLSTSPLLDSSREELPPISSISETQTKIFCKSCGDYMTPNHSCHQCGGCGKICNSRDELGEHNNTIHPLMCYRCFQFFKDKESKTKHWREIHLMNLKPTEANQGSLK